jgi:hypothetical protein
MKRSFLVSSVFDGVGHHNHHIDGSKYSCSVEVETSHGNMGDMLIRSTEEKIKKDFLLIETPKIYIEYVYEF